MNEHVVAALLYAAAFFETSTEDECDLDLAVKQLEGIADHLRQLSVEEQGEFRQFAHRLADSDPNPHLAADLRRSQTDYSHSLTSRSGLTEHCPRRTRSASGILSD